MRLARLAFASLAFTWVILVFTAPTAALGVPVSASVYAFGSLICHQRPERSFHAGLAQLPVCARCWGLYLGAALGAAAGLTVHAVRLPSREWTRYDVRSMLWLAALPTAITWACEVAGLWTPSNTTRFIAALPLGVAVAVTVNYVECARPRRSESRLPPSPI